MLRTTPIRLFHAGRTPINARRLNDVAEQLSGVARDSRHQDLSYQPGVRAGGGTSLGKLTGCPDENNVATAHRVVDGVEDSEEVTVYVHPGLWCRRVGAYCLLHRAETSGLYTYIAGDLAPWYQGEQEAGAFETVSGNLAPKQLAVSPAECSED